MARAENIAALPPPAPVWRWAGGKRALAAAIVSKAPSEIREYIEPFVGGGAVFFHLRAQGYDGPATLADENAELIQAYRAIRDQPRKLLKALGMQEHSRAQFEWLRSLSPGELSPLDRASRFLCLMAWGYNGVWRENRAGRFNVPFGRKMWRGWNEARILSASHALRNTHLLDIAFHELLWKPRASQGVFVYADPPFLPVSKTAKFDTYVRGGFSETSHVILRDLAVKWSCLGATVVISNADVPAARALYEGRGFTVERVEMRRNVNSKAHKRGAVGELLAVAGRAA